ncbi:Guanine nucleotide exchange factor Vps9 [Balamuthia mandrillaris]
MQSFWDYEVKHNQLLKALKSKHSAPLIETLAKEGAFFLVPQSVSLSLHQPQPPQPGGGGGGGGGGTSAHHELTALLDAHTIFLNPSDDSQFISMSGTRGLFLRDRALLYVVSSVPESFNPLVDVSTLFASPSFRDDFKRFDVNSARPIVILREGKLQVAQILVSVILISEPISNITPTTAPLPFPRSTQNASKPVSSSSSPSLSSSPASVAVVDTSKPVDAMSTRESRSIFNFLKTPSSPALGRSPLFPDSPSLSRPPSSKSSSEETSSTTAAIADSIPVVSPASLKKSIQLFFTKLKHPAAADILKRLKQFTTAFRSFIARQSSSSSSAYPPPSRQGQAIARFLAETRNIIAAHPLWRDATAEEMEGVVEGLEKYITTKLFSCIFDGNEGDKEKDARIHKHIRRLRTFVTHEHLDIAPAFVNHPSITLAISELQKVNDFKSPRDKLVCVLNCCKVIFNVLKNASPDKAPAGADDFLPLMIYVVLQANPYSLHSNLQYIQHFRNADKLSGEPSYFLTNLFSATSFLSTMGPGQLSINADDFERNMQKAIEEDERAAAVAKAQETKPNYNNNIQNFLEEEQPNQMDRSSTVLTPSREGESEPSTAQINNSNKNVQNQNVTASSESDDMLSLTTDEETDGEDLTAYSIIEEDIRMVALPFLVSFSLFALSFFVFFSYFRFLFSSSLAPC